MIGIARVEGFNLEALAVRLNAQHVHMLFASCPTRWPGTRFRPSELKITHIRWTWFDEEMEARAEQARESMRLHVVERARRSWTCNLV